MSLDNDYVPQQNSCLDLMTGIEFLNLTDFCHFENSQNISKIKNTVTFYCV